MSPISERPIPDLARRQRVKNVALLLILFGLAGLFYAISVVKFRVS